jgi:hypothetical protein
VPNAPKKIHRANLGKKKEARQMEEFRFHFKDISTVARN